jgi:hypothetical protein
LAERVVPVAQGALAVPEIVQVVAKDRARDQAVAVQTRLGIAAFPRVRLVPKEMALAVGVQIARALAAAEVAAAWAEADIVAAAAATAVAVARAEAEAV